MKSQSDQDKILKALEARRVEAYREWNSLNSRLKIGRYMPGEINDFSTAEEIELSLLRQRYLKILAEITYMKENGPIERTIRTSQDNGKKTGFYFLKNIALVADHNHKGEIEYVEVMSKAEGWNYYHLLKEMFEEISQKNAD